MIIEMKRMKLSTCSYLILLLLFTGAETLWGQVKDKRVDQTFTVNSSTRLRIDNKFGKVHINTWDQNKIEVQVMIEVDGSDQAARDILERIEIDISESSGEIKIETDIAEPRNKNRNQRFKINYTVKMPKNNPLSVDHRHGDVYIDNLDGPLELELAHGQIVAEELNGKSHISLQHGNGGRIAAIGSGSLEIQHYQRLRIGRMGSIDMEIAHASIEVKEAGDLDIEVRHSNVELGNAGTLNMDMQHSNLEAESLRSVSSDMQHSTLEVEKLARLLEVDCNHSQVEVEQLSNNFTRVNFEGNHSYLGLGVQPGASATLEIELQHGRLHYSESDINMHYQNIENQNREYKGKIGNGSGGQIEVEGNFTDVSIELGAGR